MDTEKWQRIKAIGAGILTAAACMDYREGRPDIEKRELEAMRVRVRELATLVGLKVRA